MLLVRLCGVTEHTNVIIKINRLIYAKCIKKEVNSL